MDIHEIFAKRIRELRLTQGLSLRQLSAKLGLSYAAISLYENRKRTPDIYTLSKFMAYFGVTGEYLMGLSDDPNKH